MGGGGRGVDGEGNIGGGPISCVVVVVFVVVGLSGGGTPPGRIGDAGRTPGGGPPGGRPPIDADTPPEGKNALPGATPNGRGGDGGRRGLGDKGSVSIAMGATGAEDILLPLLATVTIRT